MIRESGLTIIELEIELELELEQHCPGQSVQFSSVQHVKINVVLVIDTFRLEYRV